MSNAKGEKIFDLKRLVSNVKNNDVELKSVKSNITDMQKNDLLQGYTLLSKTEWNILNKGDNIRYLRVDGKFRKGGFIKSITFEGDELIKINLVNNFSYNSVGWTLYADSIQKIWRKSESQSSSSQSQNTPQNNNNLDEIRQEITLIKTNLKNVHREIQKLINEQKKIIDIMRHLNKKIERNR